MLVTQRSVILFLALVLLVLLVSCGSQTPPEPSTPDPAAQWFEDVTDRLGLGHTLHANHADPFFMPRMMSGGAVFFDYDNDDRLDVFFVPGGPSGAGTPGKLYHQKPDGTFEDTTTAAGLDMHGWGQGAAAGDINNDGHVDLFVTAYGTVWLYLNTGAGTFREVARSAGVDNPKWGTSAAFVDYDRDGWLDLVIANYIEYNPTKMCAGSGGQVDFCGPSGFGGTATRVFRNLGKAGLSTPAKVGFEDVTVRSGLASAKGPGLGVICADFDGDRWPDLFIANDGKPNHLWLNQQNGTFKEEALLRGVGHNSMGQAEANMGIALGDINNDGLFDLFVTHLSDETHRLWVQVKRGQFRDRTAQLGLGAGASRSTGFGTLLADFDHDGDEDLVLVNGLVKRSGQTPPQPAGDSFWHPYQERNLLFANDSTGNFVNISATNPVLTATAGVYRVVVVGDIDNDGAPDLLVTRVDGPARVYRNVAPNRGHWLKVRTLDPALNRDAYGAELTVRCGDRRWVRWMNPGYSYQCSNDPRAHVGLGRHDRVDGYDVLWPDGSAEQFPGGPVDQAVTLRKGTGRPLADGTKK